MPTEKEYWKKKYSKYFDSNLNGIYEKLKSKWFKFKFRKCFYKAEAYLREYGDVDKDMEKIFNKYVKIYINEEEIPLLTVEQQAYKILNDCMIKRSKQWNRIKLFIVGNMVGIFALIISFVALFKP